MSAMAFSGFHGILTGIIGISRRFSAMAEFYALMR